MFLFNEQKEEGLLSIDSNPVTQRLIHRVTDIDAWMLIFRQSLAILLVIANALHLNQVFLIWTAGNYPIHLKGTLPFHINHSVRLHQLHCAPVAAAAQWWMFVLWVPRPVSVWLVGSSGKQMIRKGLVIWDLRSPYWSSHSHRQLSHLAANSV